MTEKSNIEYLAEATVKAIADAYASGLDDALNENIKAIGHAVARAYLIGHQHGQADMKVMPAVSEMLIAEKGVDNDIQEAAKRLMVALGIEWASVR